MKKGFFELDLIDLPEARIALNRLEGGNQKHILFVFESEHDPAPLKLFLRRVLEALQLDIDKDVYLLEIYPAEQLNFSGICQETNLSQVILFGVAPARLGLHFTMMKYHPVKVGTRTYLLADELSAIQEERGKGGEKMSRALWNCLREIISHSK